MNAVQAWNLRSVVDSNGRPLINFMNGFDADTVTGPNYNSSSPVARLFGFPVTIDNNIPNLTASTAGARFSATSRMRWLCAWSGLTLVSWPRLGRQT